MKIKPVLPFRAVVTGSPWPVTFTPDDTFAPESEAAKAALDLGCLSDADAAVVRAAQGEGSPEPARKVPDKDPDKDDDKTPDEDPDEGGGDKTEDPAPPPATADKTPDKTPDKAGTKSQGAAPENKAAGD